MAVVGRFSIVDSIYLSPVVVNAGLPGMDGRGACAQLGYNASTFGLGVLCRYLAPGRYLEVDRKGSAESKMG